MVPLRKTATKARCPQEYPLGTSLPKKSSLCPGVFVASSVHAAEQPPQFLLRRAVAGLQLAGPLQMGHRLGVLVELDIDAGQVEMREMPRVVAGRVDRLLEPGDRLFPAAELDQAGAAVVVGVAEVGADLDRE